MNLSIAIVIYFAFGVPLGVLSASIRSSRLVPTDFLRVFYNLIFWPVIITRRAARTIRRSLKKDRGLLTAELQSNVESAPNESRNRSYRRRLLSTQATLVALRESHGSAVGAIELELPFKEIIEHDNFSLAAKCFHRRNIARLEGRIRSAENELSNTLSEISSPLHTENEFDDAIGSRRIVRDLC